MVIKGLGVMVFTPLSILLQLYRGGLW